jgi:nitroimidazol reductase NimA-like FMN-containing flavoprotein (pyridoxamine 5'-phosphate oxidase superfamily)
MRLACNGASGHPVLVSLWFVPIGGELWCATQKSANVVTHLRRDARCAFEVADESSPYRGVRGQGLASLDEDRAERILRMLIQRYLGTSNSKLAGWLLERAEDETAIVIEPQTLVSWDYSSRMEPAT